MKIEFSKEPFESIKDYDFTTLTDKDWDNFIIKSRKFLTEYKFVELPQKISLCVLKGEPMVVIDLLVITKDDEYSTTQISVTAFEVEHDFLLNLELTEVWRKLMSNKFEKYGRALKNHLNAVGI